jgi:hypothetical protein
MAQSSYRLKRARKVFPSYDTPPTRVNIPRNAPVATSQRVAGGALSALARMYEIADLCILLESGMPVAARIGRAKIVKTPSCITPTKNPNTSPDVTAFDNSSTSKNIFMSYERRLMYYKSKHSEQQFQGLNTYFRHCCISPGSRTNFRSNKRYRSFRQR